MSARTFPIRLPAVIRALTAARDTLKKTTDPADRILSSEQWAKLDDANPDSFFNRLLAERSKVQNALAAQTQITTRLQQATAELGTFISHFHQVFDLGVVRQTFRVGSRAYYGRDASATAIPDVSTYDAIETAAQKIVTGEAARQTAEGAAYRPMSLPSAAEVEARLGPFRELRQQSVAALTRTDLQREALAAFLPEARALAKDIVETATFFYRKDRDASSRRAKCRRWGVVYREGKKAAPAAEEKPAG